MQKYADLVCLKIAPFSLEFDQGTRPGIQKNPQGSTPISSCETRLKKQNRLTRVLAKWNSNFSSRFGGNENPKKHPGSACQYLHLSSPIFFGLHFFPHQRGCHAHGRLCLSAPDRQMFSVSKKGLRVASHDVVPWAKMATVLYTTTCCRCRLLICRKKSYQMKKASSTLRTSQAVPHPSTDRALWRLTSEFERDLVYSSWYGR